MSAFWNLQVLKVDKAPNNWRQIPDNTRIAQPPGHHGLNCEVFNESRNKHDLAKRDSLI
jgi:hypothetical protein